MLEPISLTPPYAEVYVIQDRQDLAREIFQFLHKKALRDENNPLDYAHPDAYEMHWCAKRLYNTRIPLKDIKLPDSDFERGAYKYDIITYLEHEKIMIHIKVILDR